ncbi:hypothetical protein ERC79_04275 [Rhodococcus sp. ABRD24]|uniref:hypothetical protein n=1 Tax=Rhodococcus sp. ABRD24 TaxID=2507582 RepID=UPI001038AC17|nr:hypothetical protein [Rhodococcus sp. ABRD24]QBJ95257.1 hypothetical protein ERC79_04275 [Rhodococcus sp. ABRD24]
MNSPADAVARMRGMFVGSASGAVSIAAHGLGGGVSVPSEQAVVLLVAAGAVVGAVVASLRTLHHPLLFLCGVLAVGQGMGHLTLTAASDHVHGLHLTPQMLAAHTAATVLGALLIRGAERALLTALAAVARVVVTVLSAPPVPDVRRWSPTAVRRVDPTTSRVARAAGGTRGPPTPSR